MALLRNKYVRADCDAAARSHLPLVPPYQPTSTTTAQSPYYPAHVRPPPQTSAIVRQDAPTTEPQGLVEYVLDGLKSRAPEFGANAAATRANFSEAGRAFYAALRAPLSFALTLVGAAIVLATRGEGPIGTNAVRIAVGAGHATVAELSRPKEQGIATPANDAQIAAPADAPQSPTAA